MVDVVLTSSKPDKISTGNNRLSRNVDTNVVVNVGVSVVQAVDNVLVV